MQYFPKTHQYNLVSIMHRFRQCISCFCIVWTKYFVTHIFNILVEGNLIFCFMGSWENYFGSVGRRSNNNNNNNDNNNNNNNIIIITTGCARGIVTAVTACTAVFCLLIG